MESSLFLLLSTISVLVSIFSFFFSPKNSENKRRQRSVNFSHTFFALSILLTVCMAFGLVAISRYLNEIVPSTQVTEEKISRLEDQISHLESQILLLKKENQALISEKPIVSFNTLGYDGLIIPDYSADGETEILSITLDPADEYYIECLDLNNNKIEPYLISNGKWSFIMPDRDVTIYIRKK